MWEQSPKGSWVVVKGEGSAAREFFGASGQGVGGWWSQHRVVVPTKEGVRGWVDGVGWCREERFGVLEKLSVYLLASSYRV